VNFFSQNLKFLIKRYATTQEELASYVNKKQTSISNWINENSQPDVDDLVKIHHFFGVSIDALVFTDLKNSKIITDGHIHNFQRNGKGNREVVGKVNPTSASFFVDNDGLKPEVSEADPVLLYSMTGQFKGINEKLDYIKDSVDKILKKDLK
jgi:transcriptional regulator with XRE-family HTH domain